MKRVSINLWQLGKKKASASLSLYDLEGTEELKKLIGIIEDSLKRNFPGVQVNRNKATMELFQEGKED